MKKRLFAVIMIISLVAACGGSEQATRTPEPTGAARATPRFVASRPPTETPVPTPTDVPPTTTFLPTASRIRAFEGPDYGAFFDIVPTGDGNVLAVGATNHRHVPPYSGDVLLMKLTLEGDVLWERTWGGDGYEQAWSVAQPMMEATTPLARPIPMGLATGTSSCSRQPQTALKAGSGLMVDRRGSGRTGCSAYQMGI